MLFEPPAFADFQTSLTIRQPVAAARFADQLTNTFVAAYECN